VTAKELVEQETAADTKEKGAGRGTSSRMTAPREPSSDAASRGATSQESDTCAIGFFFIQALSIFGA
jgi:hypothetical protein